MASRKWRPGDEIEAYCTKCRLNLNHIIVAVIKNAPERVKCMTCEGEHKYRPPKVKASKKKTGKTAKKKSSKKEQSSSKGPNLTAEEIEKAVVYSCDGVFKEGEILKHKKFGTGKITSILSTTKMEVSFQDGTRILIFNTTFD